MFESVLKEIMWRHPAREMKRFPRGTRDVTPQRVGRKRGAYRLGQVYQHNNILQNLLRHSVGAVELQQDVVREDVLDAKNAVLCLLLCQVHRAAALEERAQMSELGNGRQSTAVIHDRRRRLFNIPVPSPFRRISESFLPSAQKWGMDATIRNFLQFPSPSLRGQRTRRVLSPPPLSSQGAGAGEVLVG